MPANLGLADMTVLYRRLVAPEMTTAGILYQYKMILDVIAGKGKA